MRRKICILLAVFILVNSFSFAFAKSDENIECSSISFLDKAGNNITSSYTSGKITAKATLVNSSGYKINPVMLVCLYENGIMKNVWYKSAEINSESSGDVKCEFTPGTLSNSHTIKATVLKSMISLNAYYETATLFENNTDLYGILINGVSLKEYKDSENFYKVNTKTENITVEPLVKDGGAKATVALPDSVPGVAKINIKAVSGAERNINIVQITWIPLTT